MKLPAKNYPILTKRNAVNALAFILLSLITERGYSQQSVKDSVYAGTDDSLLYGKSSAAERNKPNIISSFEDLNVPPEMLMHFSQLTPENIVYFRDELQATQNNEDGIEVILTVKLQFKNNSLVGYIQEAPLEKTTQVTVSKYTVNIPVEWACTPFNKKHQQHYVSSLAAIKTAEDQYKCKNWHIKLKGEQNFRIRPDKTAKVHQAV
jgi:hypothetical protein